MSEPLSSSFVKSTTEDRLAQMEQHKVPTPRCLSPSPAFIGFRRGKLGRGDAYRRG